MLTTTKPVVLRLSFVEQTASEAVAFWEPDRSGEYEVACARGRDYADELLSYIRDEQNPTIFGSVVRAITAGGIYGAVEIGFCNRIGIQLLGL